MIAISDSTINILLIILGVIIVVLLLVVFLKGKSGSKSVNEVKPGAGPASTGTRSSRPMQTAANYWQVEQTNASYGEIGVVKFEPSRLYCDSPGQAVSYILGSSISGDSSQREILVQHSSVAQNHLLITIESGGGKNGLTVEDLDSPSGSVILVAGRQPVRLQPHVPMNLPDTAVLQVGDVKLSFVYATVERKNGAITRAMLGETDLVQHMISDGVGRVAIEPSKILTSGTRDGHIWKIGSTVDNQYIDEDQTATAGIRIMHPSVDGHHASLVHRERGLMLRDENSSKGTFIGQRKLGPGEEVRIMHKNVVRIGDVEIMFYLHSHPDDE
jgi:hypothetical protein